MSENIDFRPLIDWMTINVWGMSLSEALRGGCCIRCRCTISTSNDHYDYKISGLCGQCRLFLGKGGAK